MMPARKQGRTAGVQALHHVNLVTPQLAVMIDFYHSVLGLEPGARPSFASTGAWLYAGGQPVVHLVAGAPAPREGTPQIEHFAFACRGYSQLRAALAEKGIAHGTGSVPGLGWPIIHLTDPDGNKVEIVFPEEKEGLTSRHWGETAHHSR
jgi:catechol 2,3-dioxygenase-like lactoylglutathione lyase family enzyme